MLYAQNGATDAKLRCYEHEQIIPGLRENGQPLGFPDPDRIGAL